MTHPLKQLLEDDTRYTIEAYEFVRDALAYAHDVMGLGVANAASEASSSEAERHLTGQELCEAARRYALEQYGLMSQVVLGTWGIHATADIGEIVYNLIRVDLMRKSESDRREDFDDVYEFHRVFNDDFDFASSMRAPRQEDDEDDGDLEDED
ncbi:MAG: hypothetical protein KDA92_02220 [Planctomycetales bacterium]|nr:hypothetical protein [Planctomycetales bacterium]MCA9166741.1 hypothetical protein [Planctomycetales bacterium]